MTALPPLMIDPSTGSYSVEPFTCQERLAAQVTRIGDMVDAFAAQPAGRDFSADIERLQTTSENEKS
ncbi:MAG: hypothetical protein AAF468_12390 [Pseudomonadota bacterium]